MILVLLIGPALISLDLRFNALPLYLSRPLRRFDYFLGKLGVIVVFLGMVMILPSIIAYVFGLLFSLDIKLIADTWKILAGSIIYGLVVSVSAGLLILALSSLSRNSRYVALFWLGLWFVGGTVSLVLQQANFHERMYAARMSAFDDDLMAQQNEALKHDWRPLVSYTANLSRIGQELLGTREAWESVSQWLPPPQRNQLLLATIPQYPWYWSAIVLAVLFGISVWILNLRIKSLDRLK
jgi:ABC-2 type transport system permease protein